MLPLLVFSLATVNAQPQVNLRDLNSVRNAAAQTARVLMANYQPGRTASQGAMFDRTNDPSINGFQWWEMGVWWAAIMDYSALSGDSTHLNNAVPALTLASYRNVGSFLGPDRSIAAIAKGKWNDDILWWAFGPMTGAELFPGQTMTGGVPYLQLARQTYDEVWEQWDNNCGGGIYWSRDRITNDPQTRFFKSTITHAQQMLLGARLFAQTNRNQTYLQHTNQMMTWLRQGLISRDLDVYDGIRANPQECALFIDEHSYNAGLISGALAYWSHVSGNAQFMTEAENLARRALQRYTVNNVITDLCEAVRNPQRRCPVNQIYLKGPYIKGIAYVYRFSRNQELRNRIREVFEATSRAMLATCDSNFTCNSQDWAEGRRGEGNNIHAQINALEMMNAMLTVVTDGAQQRLNAPTASLPSEQTDLLGSASTASVGLAFASVIALLLLQ
jgi:mannan endo-1,6-alpha-mannosidase